MADTHILFLDIETVPQQASWHDLDERGARLWAHKVRNLRTEDSPETHYPRAGIYAEFGKVIVISVGFLHHQGSKLHLRIKSFAAEDEKQLLTDFGELCSTADPTDNRRARFRNLCAHNGKEFDFPFLARRMLIHGIPLPALLDQRGKKPWETPYLDTMEMWRFGDYKQFTSLSLLAYCFGIPCPKNDIDGSEVYRVYYQDNDLERIARYAQSDVWTLVQVYRRLQNQDLLREDQVIYR